MANPEHVEILKQGVEVWNRWREENPHGFPDLSGADLSRMSLRWGNFKLTDFTGANLTRTDFGFAYLNRSDLGGAELPGAALCDVDLTEADLRGTTLIWTDLHRTIFNRTWLDQAHFDNAFAASTVFVDVDLSSVIGLEKVKHHGPSSIGMDSIYKSRGQIPEVFLRGCGVPENFIIYMKSLTMNPIEYFSCFISYSHQDKSFARRLHDQLQARGIRCWLDDHQILPGDDIYEQVDRGIRMWDKVLLCCSQQSLSSWWMDNEVATAFSKEQQLMKDRQKKVLSLIPLNLDGYMFSEEWSSGKRQQIKERLAADFTGWETSNSKFEEQFERVVKALQTEGAREMAPVSRL